MTKVRLLARGLALVGGLMAGVAVADCSNLSFLDPINEVDWDCIFPISIAGIPLDFGDHPPDDTDSEFECYCEDRYYFGYGFPISYWEPALLVDTVADAWCFPAIGMDMSSNSSSSSGSGSGSGSGGSSGSSGSGSSTGDKSEGGMLDSGQGQNDSAHSFQHFHFYNYPVWSILGMFLDDSCMEDGSSFDIDMVSEVRPDWSDDFTAMALYPETALMGNEATVLACIADAAAATVQEPIDALYWCLGAWGTTYPMTGNMITRDYVEANAGLAARALYVTGRDMMLEDRAEDKCEAVYMPIWQKSHWRMQEVRPVVDDHCHVIGEPGLLWDGGKNPVGASDNFSWLIFRKVDCCVSVF